MVDYNKTNLTKLLKSYDALYDLINSRYLNLLNITQTELKNLNNQLYKIEKIINKNGYEIKINVNKFKLVRSKK